MGVVPKGTDESLGMYPVGKVMIIMVALLQIKFCAADSSLFDLHFPESHVMSRVGPDLKKIVTFCGWKKSNKSNFWTVKNIYFT